MNLVTMRQRFADHISDLDGDLTDPDIDAYLNRAYRYVIPSDVDGSITDIIWQTFTPIGASTLDVPKYVIALNKAKSWVIPVGETAPDQLDIYYDFLEFEERYPSWNDASTPAVPEAICIYGRTVYFNVRPSGAHTFKTMCRGGPAADLDSTGIENDVHAMAVVTGGAQEFLAEAEDVAGANRESALYGGYIEKLQVSSQARPNTRRPKRSF